MIKCYFSYLYFVCYLISVEMSPLDYLEQRCSVAQPRLDNMRQLLRERDFPNTNAITYQVGVTYQISILVGESFWFLISNYSVLRYYSVFSKTVLFMHEFFALSMYSRYFVLLTPHNLIHFHMRNISY